MHGSYGVLCKRLLPIIVERFTALPSAWSIQLVRIATTDDRVTMGLSMGLSITVFGRSNNTDCRKSLRVICPH